MMYKCPIISEGSTLAMPRARGVYMISVAAEILQMHPQTLRKYERAGFIEPPRSGTLRLYSEEDIVRLQLIKHFVEDLGLNLAGVQLALDIANRLLQVRGDLASVNRPSAEIAGALRQIDEVLEQALALRVLKAEVEPEEPLPLPQPQRAEFVVRKGEVVAYAQAPVLRGHNGNRREE
ncbi:MAG: MerR family transcriptional regulator [Chloroflexi bacterium]|nr:MerR family transcriptional regulator [Chloroflexota bacterium]